MEELIMLWIIICSVFIVVVTHKREKRERESDGREKK